MTHSALRFLLAMTAVPVAALTDEVPGEAAKDGCGECHGSGAKTETLRLPTTQLAKSSHAALACGDCHERLSTDHGAKKPHQGSVADVDCGGCHEDEAKAYVKHGRLEVGKAKDIPRCWSCHGAHDILPPSDRASRVHAGNLARACESCHMNRDLIKNHDILRDEPIKMYEASVHGTATKRGMEMAATCNDCHAADGGGGTRTAHRILSAADRDSPINHFNIPNTCGRCHRGTAEDYWEGVHGQLVKRGMVDAPVCTRCHGEHGILAASDLRSPVSAARLAESTCAPCHESALLNERYGIPAGRLKSYVDSYHGLKRKAGNVHVANCASCHGDHRILSHTDPRSSIHKDNLERTCGNCHPGISRVLATTPIHETSTGLRAGWPALVTRLYQWLIAILIGGMVVHNFGHWVRHTRKRMRTDWIVRMRPGETAQHWVLMISFSTLVLSGFSLRFSEAWWVDLLFGWGGGEGFVIRGLVHRISAAVFVLGCVWHVLFLFTARGRQMLRDMTARVRDFADLRQNVLFFLGRRPEGACFARFSYMEKAEYWALVWGTVIMTVTGVLLWFDNYFVREWRLAKGFLDVALVIHYYEAWLAFLAILVWHLYGTVFSPSVYPSNPAWWSGRMPAAMYSHEHPEGPRLRAHSGGSREPEELDDAKPKETS